MSASLFRSLLSSWIGLSSAILIGLCISPFVVHTLGKENYGYWTFILALTGQFVVLDLGAREAIVSLVAKYRHEGNKARLVEIVSSGAFFFACCGVLALLVMAMILPFLGSLMHVEGQSTQLLRLIFLISAIDTAIEIACGVFDATLAGSERYDVMTSLNVSRLLLTAVALWFVLNAGFGLLGLALTIIGLRIAQRVATYIFAMHYNPGLRPARAAVTRPTLIAIAKYGMWASVIHISNRLIHKVDTVIAGLFIGATGVTLYAIPVILVDQFRMFAETGNGILTPRFSRLAAAGDSATTKLLLLKWSRYSFLLALAVGGPLLVFGGDFLLLWMGESFSESIPVLILLTLPFFITLPTMVFNYYLYATNKHRLNARILALEAGSNLILSIAFVQHLGLTGIALGTFFPAILCRGIILPLEATKNSVVSLGEYLHSSFISCLPLTLAHFGVLFALHKSIGAASWEAFFLSNGLALSLFLALVWCFYLGADEKAYAKRRLSGRLS